MEARQPGGNSSDGFNTAWPIFLQVLGAVAGIASLVYLTGAAIMWLRFYSMGLEPDRAASLVPREIAFAIGLRTLLKWGAVAALLIVAFPFLGAFLERPARAIRSRSAPARRRAAEKTPSAPDWIKPYLPGVAMLLALAGWAALVHAWFWVTLPVVVVAVVAGRRWATDAASESNIAISTARLLRLLLVSVAAVTVALAYEADRDEFSIDATEVVNTTKVRELQQPGFRAVREKDGHFRCGFFASLPGEVVTCGVLIGQRSDGVYVAPFRGETTFVPSKNVEDVRTNKIAFCVAPDHRSILRRIVGTFTGDQSLFARDADAENPARPGCPIPR
jgi:hypothetical protein